MLNYIDLSEIGVNLEADIVSIIQGRVREDAKEVLKEILMSTVYAGSPTMYQRTMGVFSAVDIMDFNISGSQASFRVTINPAKIAPLIPATSKSLGAHMGLKDQDFTEELIGRLDKGGGSRIYMHPVHNFFEKTKDRLEVEIPKMLRQGLSARGWIVT